MRCAYRQYKLLCSDSNIVASPLYEFLEARCYAGMGKMDDALDIVKPLANDPNVPAWVYWPNLGSIFNAAKQYDQAITCLEKAVAISPDNATLRIELAALLLRHRRDSAIARQQLEHARKQAVGQLKIPQLIAAEGHLALEEGDASVARAKLEEALRLQQPLMKISSMMELVVLPMRTYLCLACAELGDDMAAKRYYRLVEPRLKAAGADEILLRCRQATGL